MITLEQLKHEELMAIEHYKEFLAQGLRSDSTKRKIHGIIKDERDHHRILNTIHPQ